jgi:hypothetical protein
MAPWLIRTGFESDDWIYWHLLYNHSHNQSSAEPFFLDCLGLATFSFSFYDYLSLSLSLKFDSILYHLYSLEGDP